VVRNRVSKRELEFLAGVPLFSGCSKRELQQIALLGVTVDIAPGKVLTEVGGRGREFFLLLEGDADCTVGTTTVAHFVPGAFFGELSLLDHPPQTATITATTPARILVFDAREFRELIESSPSITRKLLVTLSERIREVDERLARNADPASG